jgi:hypothetical protein
MILGIYLFLRGIMWLENKSQKSPICVRTASYILQLFLTRFVIRQIVEKSHQTDFLPSFTQFHYINFQNALNTYF